MGCLFVVLVEGCGVGGAGLGIPGLLSSPMRIRKITIVDQESSEAAVAPKLASDAAVEDLAFLLLMMHSAALVWTFGRNSILY